MDSLLHLERIAYHVSYQHQPLHLSQRLCTEHRGTFDTMASRETPKAQREPVPMWNPSNKHSLAKHGVDGVFLVWLGLGTYPAFRFEVGPVSGAELRPSASDKVQTACTKNGTGGFSRV